MTTDKTEGLSARLREQMQATKGKLYGGALPVVARTGGQCRAVWNLFLAENIERYAAEGRFLFYSEMSARLPELLKSDPRLAGLPHRAAQMTARKLDRALRECARSNGGARKGFPRFKSRYDRSDAFSFVGVDVRLAGNRVRLPKIGWLRVRGLSERCGGRIAAVAVTQEPTGWHLSIQFEATTKDRPEATLPIVGIDGGLASLATLSDGTIVENPRLAKKAAKRIRRLNRERDRRQKGSVNRRRTVGRLARTHRAVANARRDAMHKATSRLVDTYAGFAVEDLSLSGLMRTRMAGSFADAGLGEFLRTLRYKAEWAGRAWLVHGRFKRSTGVCPDCSHVGEKLGLSIRSWACTNCGAVHDRDVAAARVILSGAVPPVRREPAGKYGWRKRGAAVSDGAGAKALASRSGPPSNIARAAK